MKLTSQTRSPTCVTPTFCPANTWLRLTFRLLKQMRPHWVTVNVAWCNGKANVPGLYSRDGDVKLPDQIHCDFVGAEDCAAPASCRLPPSRIASTSTRQRRPPSVRDQQYHRRSSYTREPCCRAVWMMDGSKSL